MLRKKQAGKKVKVWLKKRSAFFVILFTPAIVIFVVYNLAYVNKVFPGVFIADINVSGLRTKEGVRALSDAVIAPEKISIVYDDKTFDIEVKAIEFSYNYPQSIKAAYTLDRTGNILLDFHQRLKAPFRHKNLGLRFDFDEEKLDEGLINIAEQAAIEPVAPSVELVNGNVVVKRGSPGILVDIKKLKAEIGQSFAFAKETPIKLPLMSVDPTINEAQAKEIEARAISLLGKSLVLESEENRFVYEEDEIITLLFVNGEYHGQNIQTIIARVADSVNRKPQNSIFTYEQGRVKEFAPAKDGLKVDKDLLETKIVGNLRSLETSNNLIAKIEIPIERTAPKVKTEDVNKLGIKELIGKGSSGFAGSIPSRVHNITLSASKFNGTLIKPGEIFSFNDTLGDVSAYTGYQQAYIIKNGRTVLGDGGGVCQVSTTLFRAILDAGLPVVERRAHSYRVSYYEQDSAPGFDATVYGPFIDLKFKNDTPGHLLVQTRVDPRTSSLVFEIYGTDDARVVEITKPVITSVTAPPEDLYQDDPTLPLGTIKQIDFKAWGAKVNISYKVTRNGEELFSKTFYSNFRPWQAIYLRGTGPVN